ncbi:MAG: hypothetical protein GWO38_31410, partial [Phycisphaerae bacterium]|nr:hypothetical protein [Phycisphaerae bacterium]NIP55664.1 hypothetical protein [Phycisphaerae bacterium]NIX01915.1 hypothetical protein [Phycisphaerae bacterium]NIX32012.1 hypothetical protein [Phycisphaerae bacterium]
MPENIIDVLSRIPNHEYILITSEGLDYRVTKIEIEEPDWSDVGDVATLPFVFETNTVITNGTEVSTTINELMANDSEAINIRGNNKRIYQLGDIANLQGLYIAADKSTLSEAVRISIADLISTGASDVDRISTGLNYGGELSVNSSDPSTFDISAGQAVIVNSYDDPENPTFTFVEWGVNVGIAVTDIATQILTFVKVDINGDFLQEPDTNGLEEHRDKAELGLLVHTDNATIEKVAPLPQWNRDTSLSLTDLTESLGTIGLFGNAYSPNGANLRINKDLGLSFVKGG